MKTVSDIRGEFARQREDFGPDDYGMLEITSCQFIADEEIIFGDPVHSWHARELVWYLSQSRNVNDIIPPVPKLWQEVSGSNGEINSNYGWCIFSEENGYQFTNAIKTLTQDPYSRQAVMIYTRPSMHADSKVVGMRDFMCTNQVQLLIRNGMLHYLVYMRSSDAIYGYKGDFAWHRWVKTQALEILRPALKMPNLSHGPIVWHAGSFHIYDRNKNLVDHYITKRGEAQCRT